MIEDNQIFEVGGCVRDEILGVFTNDIDFTYVVRDPKLSVQDGFKEMKGYLTDNKFEIFLETEDCFTIRAKFPTTHENAGLVADFVMARKEIGYIPGTRRPILELGTLDDDLSRRDFTLNALAKDSDGNIIDLFEGRKHLAEGILITPLNPHITFLDDPLRVIRALRFSITKGFTIHYDTWEAMFNHSVVDKLKEVVSQERIRGELQKMFNHDSLETIRLFNEVDKIEPKFLDVVFRDGLWLLPTMKKK